MGFYGGGWVKKMIDIQRPAKIILQKMGFGSISLDEAKELVELLKAISELPKLDKTHLRNPNTLILIETWEESKKHFTKEFLSYYEPILDQVMNFGISKFDYDNFYEGLAQWYLGEVLRRGWQFPGHNRPNSQLWHGIPPETRARLGQSIQANYTLLQDRLKVINEKFGEEKDNKERDIHRVSRYEQFINRILTDVEREVIAWH